MSVELHKAQLVTLFDVRLSKTVTAVSWMRQRVNISALEWLKREQFYSSGLSLLHASIY